MFHKKNTLFMHLVLLHYYRTSRTRPTEKQSFSQLVCERNFYDTTIDKRVLWKRCTCERTPTITTVTYLCTTLFFVKNPNVSDFTETNIYVFSQLFLGQYFSCIQWYKILNLFQDNIELILIALRHTIYQCCFILFYTISLTSLLTRHTSF